MTFLGGLMCVPNSLVQISSWA